MTNSFVIVFTVLSFFTNMNVVTEETYEDEILGDEFEISGIIVDETQTKLGRDFYELFFRDWNPVESLPDLSIVISEDPLPRLGTRISVSIQDNVIFQSFLQPRYEQIEEYASYAVLRAMSYLENYEQIQEQLQGDDLSGTGIF